MGFQVKRFITYLLFLFSVNAYSQSIALAVPVQNIELDGSFVDWPETMYWNSINNYYGSGEQSNEDFQARFSTGYDLDEGSLYIALQVLDDEFVGKNGNNHSTQDHMLLYLDLGHRMSGGSPVFYVGSDEVLEIHHKPGNYDETNHELTLENAELKRKRLGNLLQYEWKISVKKELVPHRVLGVDFMIIDHDVSEDSEDILLWKNGFG
ncbi:MAG: sugar-binding protein, partial [Bacteroidota bacterium]